MTTEVLIVRLRDTTALSDPLLTHEAADALEALGREVAELIAERDQARAELESKSAELESVWSLSKKADEENDTLRAELAAIRAKMVPLTGMNKRILFECVGLRSPDPREYYILGFEAAERAHGITGEPK